MGTSALSLSTFPFSVMINLGLEELVFLTVIGSILLGGQT